MAAAADEERTRSRVLLPLAAAMLLVHVAATGIAGDHFPGSELLFGIVVWGGAWVAGDRTRLRRERMVELEERALRAEREAERERRLAAAEERTPDRARPARLGRPRDQRDPRSCRARAGCARTDPAARARGVRDDRGRGARDRGRDRPDRRAPCARTPAGEDERSSRRRGSPPSTARRAPPGAPGWTSRRTSRRAALRCRRRRPRPRTGSSRRRSRMPPATARAARRRGRVRRPARSC